MNLGSDAMPYWITQTHKAEAEIERLRAALKTAREALLIVQANLLADDFPSTRFTVDAALASSEPKP